MNDDANAQPRVLDDPDTRAMARAIRDGQWNVLEKAAEHGTLWVNLWNKTRRPEAPDERRFGLIDGMETFEWFTRHPDWLTQGAWSAEREAFPVTLTDEGRKALANRAAFDMEPVCGGLVEPGWQAIPAPRTAS